LTRFGCVAVAGLLLLGCEQQGGFFSSKEGIGTVLGGVAGGVLGSTVGGGKGRLVATGAGALLGGLAGSAIGRSMDQRDNEMLKNTTQRSLEAEPTGRTSSWRNPDTGASGTITPQRTYTANDGEPCREFQQTVTIGGKTEQAIGTACRQSDGSWRIVNN